MTIYKTKLKRKMLFGGLTSLLGAGSKLAGTVGKVGEVVSKVAPIASAVGQMLPQGQSEDPTQQAQDITKTAVKTGLSILPGGAAAAPVLEAYDSITTGLTGSSDTGKAINNIINPLSLVGNTVGAISSGNVADIPIAKAIFGGESSQDKLKKQMAVNAVTDANTQAQKNNAGANARYVKQGGSINRILRASKGLSFQLGLLQSKENEFKVGGVLPSYHTNKNVILAGVLHKDNHDICELEDKSCGVIYGKKGIPVVSNNQKVAEIEKEELVFTKEVAKQIEVLVTKYNKSKSNDVKLELGKYIYEQLNVNTIDNTKI
jgi:hypothetical protein